MRRMMKERRASTTTEGGQRPRSWTKTALTFPVVCALAAAGLLLAVPTGASILSAGGAAPTISSDLPDYNPGGTVTLTGADWNPGEAVHIYVAENNTTVTWSLDSNPDPVADGSGGFTYKFQLPMTFIASYNVTATGQSSGATATTTFTDGSPAANLDDCQNGTIDSPESCNTANATNQGNWTNGDLNAGKAHYLEGDSVPFRMRLSDLDTSFQHSITIDWDTTKGGKHAFDYLTSFDRTVTDADPCVDVSPCSGRTDFTVTPDDPNVTGEGVTPAEHAIFSCFGCVIIGASAFSLDAPYSGDSTTSITLTFTASQENPVIAWGAHVATRQDWGFDNSAVAINGSPYHVGLNNLDGNGGSQDHQMQSEAAIFPAEIKITKDAVPDSAQDFGFTTSGLVPPLSSPGSFTLDDDTDSTLSNLEDITNIASFGEKTVTEGVVSDWPLTALDCTVTPVDPTKPSTTSTDLDTQTATIGLNEGDLVECTFTDTRATGTIELKKDWVGTASSVDLNIGTSAGAHDVDQEPSLTSDGSTGQNAVDTGTYYVSESVTNASDYTSSLACFNDNGAGTGGIADDGIKNGTEPSVLPGASDSVSVGSGDHVICTYTNTRKRGTIELKKAWVGTAGQTTLNIGVTAGGSTIASTLTGPNGGAPLTTTQKAVDTGSFYVSETGGLSDYSSSLACFNDNGAGGGTANNGIKDGTEPAVFPGAGDSVSVGSGDHVICTFTNTRKRGTIELKKHWVGMKSSVNLKIGTTAGGNEVDQELGLTNDGSTGQNPVDTGTYYVSESVTNASDYTSSLACFNDNGTGTGGIADDGIKNGTEPAVLPGASDSVSVGSGDHIVCTYTNTRNQGTIVIQKITKPTGGSTSFNFETNPEPPYTHFSLASGGTNSQTLNTGTYTVKEFVPLGWVLTGLGSDPADPNDSTACSVSGSNGSDGHGNLSTQTATIHLKKGDTVTCVFENTGQGATRTQGFWATHARLANIAWFGGNDFGHNFAGVASVPSIGDRTLCNPVTKDMSNNVAGLTGGLSRIMGGFWSDISKTSVPGKRSAIDQARMQLVQQLLAGELNAAAFGSIPSSGSFATWEGAYCGSNQTVIKDAQQQAASFNSQGDSSTFTPGTSADSKNARAIANIPYWNTLP
jgi:hypothetical protein